MNIALVDVDGHSGFPNLALMRLSAWHKAQGDSVEWWNGFTHYDRVYLSKVFTFTPDFDTVIDADEIITGGTGYKDYTNLPPEVEAIPPDYSIYPHYKRAVGFLTRRLPLVHSPPQGGLYPPGGHLGAGKAPGQPGNRLSGQQCAGLRAWPGADWAHGRRAGMGGL